MFIENLGGYVLRIRIVLSSLALGICITTSLMLYALTDSIALGAISFAILGVTAFFSCKIFLSFFFAGMKIEVFSPIFEEVCRHQSMMINVLDMAVSGKMLPRTRDDFLLCILLEESHHESFISMLKRPEFSHILVALHDFLDRHIAALKPYRMDKEEKIILMRLEMLKEHLPEIAKG